MASEAVTAARQTLGKELRSLREATGMTQQELADRLGYSRPRVAGAEKGDGCALLFWQGCDKILNAKGALVAGFRQIEEIRRREAEDAAEEARARRTAQLNAPNSRDGLEVISPFSVASHKFIAAHIGHQAARRIMAHADAVTTRSQWFDCNSVPTGHSAGRCDLYVWPFGVAVFHLREDLEMPSIGKLALWRVRSYEENLLWATTRLRQLTTLDSVSASYVLSAYWVTEHRWTEEQTTSALKIICTPRVLLKRDPGQSEAEISRAEQVERTLLLTGFAHDAISAFGFAGISIGYASWSGVVYRPISPEQALTDDDLICCELAIQAIWAFCEHINKQVEDGKDPVAPESFGWRFLRGVRSRLTNPRPQETGQHRAMRDAIIETSGILGQLDQAISVLQQIEG